MSRPRSQPCLDAGLLVLRIGLGACFMLLWVLPQAGGSVLFPAHPGRKALVALTLAGLLVMLGLVTRPAAATLALIWVWALYSEAQAGQQVFVEPYRSALFAMIFVVLVITGPGRFSIDFLILTEQHDRRS